MKILILTPHFYPEQFKCNDMAFELQRRGHDVSVMTAIPDYPCGNFHKGYGVFKNRRQIIKGIKVHRSFLIPRGNGSAIRLAINYLSYTFFSIIKSIWFGLYKRYDVIIVHETSPVMVGIPAVIISKLQHIPVHFWVLDLWPESISAAGGIRNKTILSIFNRLTIWLYQNSKSILISSKGFRESITNKGDFDFKIKYFPNWVDRALEFGTSHNVPNYPTGFNVVYAGNMGDAQDLPHILQTVEILKGTNINFIFIGDGRKKTYVEKFAKEHDLESQISCFGRYPIEYMPEFFHKADVLFLALKDIVIFAMTVPARLQAYMAAGKPIVAMINGEGADLIKEADCGWCVPAENSTALADCLRLVSTMDRSYLESKGKNGKTYSQKYFDFTNCINNLEDTINDRI